jgi:hypothetical protein
VTVSGSALGDAATIPKVSSLTYGNLIFTEINFDSYPLMESFINTPGVPTMLAAMVRTSVKLRKEIGFTVSIGANGSFILSSKAVGDFKGVPLHFNAPTAFTVHTHWVAGILDGWDMRSYPSPTDEDLSRRFGVPGIVVNFKFEAWAYGSQKSGF